MGWDVSVCFVPEQVPDQLIMTIADHAAVGAWHRFERGKLIASDESNDQDGQPYADYPLVGLEATYGVKVQRGAANHPLLIERFLPPLRGWCVFSSSPHLHPGRPLTRVEIQQVMADDVPGAAYECLLIYDDD